MANGQIQLKKSDSTLPEVDELQEAIRRRAYDLFLGRDEAPSDPLQDWLQAERETVWRPAIDLREQDGEIDLTVAAAGVDPKDLDVWVTPRGVLVKGQSNRDVEAREGTVYVAELRSGQLFRSVRFPQPIDPKSAKAEFRNGVLRLTARLVSPTPEDSQSA